MRYELLQRQLDTRDQVTLIKTNELNNSRFTAVRSSRLKKKKKGPTTIFRVFGGNDTFELLSGHLVCFIIVVEEFSLIFITENRGLVIRSIVSVYWKNFKFLSRKWGTGFIGNKNITNGLGCIKHAVAQRRIRDQLVPGTYLSVIYDLYSLASFTINSLSSVEIIALPRPSLRTALVTGLSVTRAVETGSDSSTRIPDVKTASSNRDFLSLDL